MCRSQGAQLATVKSFGGPRSQERKLFTKYLESQSDSLTLPEGGRIYFMVWVKGSSAGSSSDGSSLDRMGNIIYIEEGHGNSGKEVKEANCKSTFLKFPVCEKRPNGEQSGPGEC